MVNPSWPWSTTEAGLPGSEVIFNELEILPERSMLTILPDSWLKTNKRL